MKLKLRYLNSNRAFCWCPFHTSKKGNADLEICLSGKWQGKYYCHGCGQSGYVTMDVLNKLLKKQKKLGFKEPTAVDFNSLVEQYCDTYDRHGIKEPFDVSWVVGSILDIGWDGSAWTIPFRNNDREVVGIQRRFPDGFKCMVEGGSLGIIIPGGVLDHSIPLYLTEGASDLAVVLECELQGIGRPNCNAIEDQIVEFCEPFKEIIVVADNDAPGLNGAMSLVNAIPLATKVIIKTPKPYDDLYSMYQDVELKETKKWLLKN